MFEIVNDVKRLFVMPVAPEVYVPYIIEGEKLTDDKDDAPIVALAL
ncbi:Uncharacterised protein [uncultured archaeon]|nr:Uncharacterised protein [uncultured archaeon]